jgi:hypothetical protein
MIPKPTHAQIRGIIRTVEQWRAVIAAEQLPFPSPNPYEATLFMLTEVGEAVDALIRSYSRTAYTRASRDPKRAKLHDELLDVAFMAASIIGGRRLTAGQISSALSTAFQAHPLPENIREAASFRQLLDEPRIREHELRYLITTRLTYFAAQACAAAEELHQVDRGANIQHEAAIRIGPVSQPLLFLATCGIVVAYSAAALQLSQTVLLDSYEDTRPDWFIEDLQQRLDERREKVIRHAAIIASSKPLQ